MSNVACKYTGSTIFTVCIVYTKVCLRFSIVCWHLICGVIMGFAINRTALNCVLYMLLGLFLIIFSNFGFVSYTQVRLIHECDLHTSATYTRVRLIHKCNLYTSATYTWVRLTQECDLHTSATYTRVRLIHRRIR